MMKRPSGNWRKSLSPNAKDWNTVLQRVGDSQDKAAFGEIFSHFAPLLKGFLLKSGGLTEESAEELVQETMIKVWRKAPSYSSAQAAASTWMYTIARNTRIDWLRKHSRRNSLEELTADEIYDEPDDTDETPFTNLVQVRNQKNIRDQLGELPADQMHVLQLMYFQGKSGQEVADELSIPLGTVKSRARLALQKLKVRLDEEALA